MPDVLMMGLTEEQFWQSNPRTLAPYIEVYQRKQFEIDKMLHSLGGYVYEAVGAVLSNFGKRPRPYPSKPHMASIEEEHRIEQMTEEEQLEKVEQIFQMLSSGHER